MTPDRTTGTAQADHAVQGVGEIEQLLVGQHRSGPYDLGPQSREMSGMQAASGRAQIGRVGHNDGLRDRVQCPEAGTGSRRLLFLERRLGPGGTASLRDRCRGDGPD